jgi:hypothetical protein
MTPAGWLGAACLSVALLLAFAMLDGMACSQYARWAAGSTPPAVDPLYRPAVLIDGKLCAAAGGCSPAVLVEGVLSTDTLLQLAARAHLAAPARLTACFNSPGGAYLAASVADALPANIRTCVPDRIARPGASPYRALCASACAWTWMAGSERVIYGRSSVGFHAPYEYDAAVCLPGNRLKGLVAAVQGWIRDRNEPRYDERLRGARSELRLASISRGPTELLPIGPDRAVELGLQTARAGAATFYVAQQPQMLPAR